MMMMSPRRSSTSLTSPGLQCSVRANSSGPAPSPMPVSLLTVSQLSRNLFSPGQARVEGQIWTVERQGDQVARPGLPAAGRCS